MKKILIVDDEKDVRGLLSMRLLASGFKVLEAGDGAAALALAKQERPDLILLDIMMPGKDGVETYHALRKDPETSEIPVIFLTVLAQNLSLTKYSLDLDQCYAILGKPYEPQELLKEIQRALGGPVTQSPKGGKLEGGK